MKKPSNNALVAGLYFLIPPLAVLAPLGLAPLSLLIAVVLALITPRPWKPPSKRAALLLFLPVVLALSSSAWSLTPLISLKSSFQLAALAVAAWVLAATARTAPAPHAARAVAAGVATAFALMAVDRIVDNRLIGFIHGMDLNYVGWELFAQSSTKRGSVIIAVIMWPTIGALLAEGRRLWAAAALSSGFAAVFIGHSDTAFLAVAGAAALVAACRFSLRRTAVVFAVLTAASAFSLPWALQQLPEPQELWDAARWIPNSAHHRLTIWGFSADRISEKPLLGWGMDTARNIPGGEDQIFVTRRGYDRDWVMFEQLLPLHPHNAPVQWWLELGGLGAAAMTALTCFLILAAARLPAPQAPFVLAGMCASLICAASAFGAWQSWWLSGLALIAALSLFPTPKETAS